MNFFSSTQYLLGDSDYECRPFMVSTYKKPNNAVIPREHEVFNTALTAPRVSSEHTIAIWKGRFPWLQGIRMYITEEKESLHNILKVMDATVILHNFLMEEGETDFPDEWWDDKETSSVGDAISETDELNNPLHPFMKVHLTIQEDNNSQTTSMNGSSHRGKRTKKSPISVCI
jgi:DDE superfamily endonuclease